MTMPAASPTVSARWRSPDDGWVVNVRPEQVIEIAVDALQRSIPYPRRLALRFTLVVRYRDDKGADEADAMDAGTQLL